MSISICNYNILSTRLADPNYHKNCKPGFLETNYRWANIRKKIREEIKNNSIICLQELSEEWISLFLCLFTEHEYVFVYDSQWLGVGIAYPNKLYYFKNANFISVGEEIKKQCKYKQINWFTNIYMRIKGIFTKPIEDVWTTASKRINRIVGISLISRLTEQSFNVFTYHMPCAFTNPDLMNIHASMLLKIVQQTSNRLPYILAGDFNSKPDSDVYKLMTSRSYRPNYPLSKLFSKLPSFIGMDSMYSAYMSINQKEPLFTNYSHCGKDAFKDCIDYIFTSCHFECTKVTKLREDHPSSTFPNEEEPSDHLAIGATLILQSDQTSSVGL